MSSKAKLNNPQQLKFDNVVSVRCACGCGQWFIAAKTPRMREYLNDTHKKRAARRRAKERRELATVKLAPKGWYYLNVDSERSRETLWELSTKIERDLITLMCEKGYTLEELHTGMSLLYTSIEIPF